jgi:hypothetical protein
MFSNYGEIELLYAKVVSEESLVSNWIVVEGAYSFRGDRKPLILRKLIENDVRFKSFLSRIHVVEVNENLIENFQYGAKYLARKKIEIFLRKIFFSGHINQKRLLLEKKFFYAENNSRDAAIVKIFELSKSENDWILISDLDEILNLTNTKIRDSVIDIMDSDNLFSMLYRQKFAFDFDNLDAQQRFTPLINIELLRRNATPSLSQFRSRFDGIPQIKYPYITEYTFCFDLQTILKKYEMFPHVSPSRDSLLEALKINATPLYADSSTRDIRWYQKVDILDYCVPEYILNNIEKLKTNNIDLKYQYFRKLKFPELFK